jgi:hypothetical protein
MEVIWFSVKAPAANDVWAIGFKSGSSDGLVEHWDGKSWSLVNTPRGVGLNGVTVLSDVTVVAVGVTFDSSGVSQAVILSNSWRDDQRYAQAPAAQSGTTGAQLHTAAADQLFAAVGKAH